MADLDQRVRTDCDPIFPRAFGRFAVHGARRPRWAAWARQMQPRA